MLACLGRVCFGVAQVACYLCGHEFGTASLTIHHKACKRKRATELNRLAQRMPRRYQHPLEGTQAAAEKPPQQANDRNNPGPGARPGSKGGARGGGGKRSQAPQQAVPLDEVQYGWAALPEGPEPVEFPLPKRGASGEKFERYNREALRIFGLQAACCEFCGTRFMPEQMDGFLAHIKGCNAERAVEIRRRREESEALEARRLEEERLGLEAAAAAARAAEDGRLRDEGYEEGFKEGRAHGFDEGFDEGYETGKKQAEEMFDF